MKPVAEFSSFEDLDMRVGRVIVVETSLSRKPTYRLTLDFGSEIGIKHSVGAYRNYAPEDLVGHLVVGVVNFPAKKMGPEVSEVLVLGVENERGEIIHLTTEAKVPLGVKVF
ncbi:MAG: protein secretion chaperonin CsaA [Candidatus Limnocylindrales bacterium]